MDTTTDALRRVRGQVLDQTIPLLDSDKLPAGERFRLILQLAQTKGSPELYERALQLAQDLDEDDKLNAHLDLLAGIDATIQEQNSTNDSEAEVDQDE